MKKSKRSGRKIRVSRTGTRLCLCAVIAACVCCSCNVTRTITNESQYFQRGDTAVVIQTKTIETYDVTKNM